MCRKGLEALQMVVQITVSPLAGPCWRPQALQITIILLATLSWMSHKEPPTLSLTQTSQRCVSTCVLPLRWQVSGMQIALEGGVRSNMLLCEACI